MERACKLSTLWGTQAQPDPRRDPRSPPRRDPIEDESFDPQFNKIDATAHNLIAMLPPLKGSSAMGGEIQHDWFQGGIDPIMVHVWTLSLCSIIQLHNIKASFENQSYNNCLDAAYKMVEICREIQDFDFRQLDLILGVHFVSFHVLG